MRAEGAQLKEALAARNMKSGGTLRQRAERLMLCRGKALSDLPATVFVKGAVPASLQDPARRAKHLAFAHTLASQEARIGAVAESLNAQPGTVIDNTAQWVVKKQAQNYDELKADLEREDLDDAPEGSDAEVRLPPPVAFVTCWLSSVICTLTCMTTLPAVSMALQGLTPTCAAPLDSALCGGTRSSVLPDLAGHLAR